MDNMQIAIAENGTKTLATAGKYCDRNIDINVNVPVKPTQFVNVLEYADSLEVNKKFTSNGGYATSYFNSVIAVTLDLRKLPSGIKLTNNTNEFRYRGCCFVDNTFAMSADGITYSAKGMNYEIKRVDEYGDAVFQRGYIGERYVRFNIGIVSTLTSGSPVLADDFDPIAFGCIVTFNQPIGNGGHTE